MERKFDNILSRSLSCLNINEKILSQFHSEIVVQCFFHMYLFEIAWLDGSILKKSH